MPPNKRHLVIELAVHFESSVSQALCFLLNIDSSTSKAFGNSSKALSFTNKLTLLSDIKVIDKKERIKFDYFSAIRNQFAHNKSATDFTSCFSFIDMENNLSKLYDIEIDQNKELHLENLFFHLYADLLEFNKKVIDSCKTKSFNEGVSDAKHNFLENLVGTLKVYAQENVELYEHLVKVFHLAAKRTREQIDSSSRAID